MKLLFITHKINELDDDYAFTSLWAREFIRQGIDVDVICYERGAHSGDFRVISLGKERGYGHIRATLLFWKHIITLDYDCVFVHMNPKWLVAGALLWRIKKIPVYLWYTHYSTHIYLKISHFLCRYLFAATKESMPQYEGDKKKIVTGHGIDTSFWKMELPERQARNPKNNLLSVHRICRSKRIHLTIEALANLPRDYTLTIYGRVLEPDYKQELDCLTERLGLKERVFFKNPVPMPELRKIYPQYQIIVNMASATIDKTMVEAMLAGVQPVVSRDNAIAVGLPHAPNSDCPQDIAKYIKELELLNIDELISIAKNKHSLTSLVKNLIEHMTGYGKNNTRMLYITHKIDIHDPVFAFTELWANEFIKQGLILDVVCMEKGEMSRQFKVFSLGKEKKISKPRAVIRFWKHIILSDYDCVFVHMNPKWVVAGMWYWWIKKIPVYLWYAHASNNIYLRISMFFCEKVFTSSIATVPSYQEHRKRVVIGQGVDMEYWTEPDFNKIERKPVSDLLIVCRISAQKRHHVAIQTLKYLPLDYNLTIYGPVFDKKYYNELKNLVSELGLCGRVKMLGPIEMSELKDIYPQYRTIINFAPHTIDKTILEAMSMGVHPVVSPENREPIGLPNSPSAVEPRIVAEYILNVERLSQSELRDIVFARHSLCALVKKVKDHISLCAE